MSRLAQSRRSSERSADAVRSTPERSARTLSGAGPGRSRRDGSDLVPDQVIPASKSNAAKAAAKTRARVRLLIDGRTVLSARNMPVPS